MTGTSPHAAAIRLRLARVARERREDFQRVLTRYGLERLLYRLSRSAYADAFILKGAMLFALWSEELHRPTRDLDLLGHGENNIEQLKHVFRTVCDVEVEDDGLKFDAMSVHGERIREGRVYEGVRIRFQAMLGSTRIPIHIDIGFGDVITPAPSMAEYPAMLDLPAPTIRAYPPETVVAEKYQAIVELGSTNSRMKDFYDLWMIAKAMAFEGATLSAAILQTFTRRNTPLPGEVPVGLTVDWATGDRPINYWQGFLDRYELAAGAPDLGAIAPALQVFLTPPTQALLAGAQFTMQWVPGGPWSARVSDDGIVDQ